MWMGANGDNMEIEEMVELQGWSQILQLSIQQGHDFILLSSSSLVHRGFGELEITWQNT